MKVGRYRVEKLLATGGMAEVYLASVQGAFGFERQVALKQIRAPYKDDPDFRAMFIDEARVAARLSHPNIVSVFDFGETDGTLFIVMEHIRGETLAALLKSGRFSATVPEVAWLGEQVALALQHAGATCGADFVHRDVSPSNLMITEDGGVKLVDFGIARARERYSVTHTGELKGKAAYMSPEQAAGETLLPASDQFALGLVLAECLLGQRVLQGSDPDVLAFLQSKTPIVLDRLPRELSPVLAQVLSPAPADRYGSFDALAQALRQVRKGTEDVQPSRLVRWVMTEHTERQTSSIPEMTEVERAPVRKTKGVRWTLVLAGVGTLLWGAAELASPKTRTPPQPASPAHPVLPHTPAQNPSAALPVPPALEPAPIEPRRVSVPPRFGSLELRTIGLWAQVHLGARALGNTPLSVDRLPVGRHQLRLKHPSIPGEKVVEVVIGEGERARLTVAFP